LNAPLPGVEPAKPIHPAASAPGGHDAPFIADGARGPDLLDMGAAVQPIVEVIAHREAETPMMIGLVGPSGAGKSFALERVITGVAALSAAVQSGSGPFVDEIVTARIDAAAVGGDPGVAIAAATYAALCRNDGDGSNYAALADDAAHAGADPHLAASKAVERHDDARRRLDSETQSRDEVEARRARLSDVVLFETPGSRVDAYARANRGRIETRLRRFDLIAGEPIANYKDLVRDLAGAGSASRAAVVVRAIWAYRSQTRLLLWTILFFVLAILAAQLGSEGLGKWLRNLGAPTTAIADWLAAHGDLIGDVVLVFSALGVLALALNLWRAFIFTGGLYRGVRLLNFDLRERGRDLDSASARLNRRIAALTAEAEAAARHAEAAEKRAKSEGRSAPLRGPSPTFLESSLAPQAASRAFMTAVGKAIAGEAEREIPTVSLTPSAPVTAPKRMLLAFDNLDALSTHEARQLIETAHSLLSRGFIAVFAFDPDALRMAFADETQLTQRLEKVFPIIFNVAAASVRGDGLAGRLLSGAPGATSAQDPRSSMLSEPIGEAEASVLTAVAPLAAATPRGVKRFLNAYRLARPGAGNRAALALALAAQQGGDPAARAALEQMIAAGAMDDPAGPPALAAAVRAAGPITAAEFDEAKAQARRFGLS
jgi:hypothetical protein